VVQCRVCAAKPRHVLSQLYHEQSLLLVFFLSAEYVDRAWCGLEWRSGRDLLKKKEDDRLMFLRFDGTDVPGLHSIDGYLDISRMHDEDVSAEILKRVALLTPIPAGDLDKIVTDIRTHLAPNIQLRYGRIRVLTMERPIDLGCIYTYVHFLEKRPANVTSHFSGIPYSAAGRQKDLPSRPTRTSCCRLKMARGLASPCDHGRR
jgi:hypothetical protein